MPTATKASQPNTSLSSSSKKKRWSFLSRKKKKKQSSDGISTSTSNDNDNCPDLPAAIWLSNVLVFLDRFSQDSFVQVHREVWLARRDQPTTVSWPSPGRISRFSRPVKSIAFVTAGNTGSEELWVAYCKSHIKSFDKLRGHNSEQKAILKHATRGSNIIAAVQCSPVDPSIVATAGERDGCIRLWKCNHDVNHWTCFRQLEVYQHTLRHMLWSPNGQHIATWGQDGLLQVTNVETGNCQSIHWKTKLEVAGCNRTVAFTPNGLSILFARNHDILCQWDFSEPASGTFPILPLCRDHHGSHPGTFFTSLAFSPNGERLAVGCHVARIVIYSVVRNPTNPDERFYSFQYKYSIPVGSGWSAVALITFSPDGKLVACTNQGSQIRIVQLASADCIARVLTTFQGHSGRIESLCFTNNGKILASGSCDRTVRLWDIDRLMKEQQEKDEATLVVPEERLGMV